MNSNRASHARAILRRKQQVDRSLVRPEALDDPQFVSQLRKWLINWKPGSCVATHTKSTKSKKSKKKGKKASAAATSTPSEVQPDIHPLTKIKLPLVKILDELKKCRCTYCVEWAAYSGQSLTRHVIDSDAKYSYLWYTDAELEIMGCDYEDLNALQDELERDLQTLGKRWDPNQDFLDTKIPPLAELCDDGSTLDTNRTEVGSLLLQYEIWWRTHQHFLRHPRCFSDGTTQNAAPGEDGTTANPGAMAPRRVHVELLEMLKRDMTKLIAQQTERLPDDTRYAIFGDPRFHQSENVMVRALRIVDDPEGPYFQVSLHDPDGPAVDRVLQEMVLLSRWNRSEPENHHHPEDRYISVVAQQYEDVVVRLKLLNEIQDQLHSRRLMFYRYEHETPPPDVVARVYSANETLMRELIAIGTDDSVRAESINSVINASEAAYAKSLDEVDLIDSKASNSHTRLCINRVLDMYDAMQRFIADHKTDLWLPVADLTVVIEVAGLLDHKEVQDHLESCYDDLFDALTQHRELTFAAPAATIEKFRAHRNTDNLNYDDYREGYNMMMEEMARVYELHIHHRELIAELCEVLEEGLLASALARAREADQKMLQDGDAPINPAEALALSYEAWDDDPAAYATAFDHEYSEASQEHQESNAALKAGKQDGEAIILRTISRMFLSEIVESYADIYAKENEERLLRQLDSELSLDSKGTSNGDQEGKSSKSKKKKKKATPNNPEKKDKDATGKTAEQEEEERKLKLLEQKQKKQRQQQKQRTPFSGLLAAAVANSTDDQGKVEEVKPLADQTVISSSQEPPKPRQPTGTSTTNRAEVNNGPAKEPAEPSGGQIESTPRKQGNLGTPSTEGRGEPDPSAPAPSRAPVDDDSPTRALTRKEKRAARFAHVREMYKHDEQTSAIPAQISGPSGSQTTSEHLSRAAVQSDNASPPKTHVPSSSTGTHHEGESDQTYVSGSEASPLVTETTSVYSTLPTMSPSGSYHGDAVSPALDPLCWAIPGLHLVTHDHSHHQPDQDCILCLATSLSQDNTGVTQEARFDISQRIWDLIISRVPAAEGNAHLLPASEVYGMLIDCIHQRIQPGRCQRTCPLHLWMGTTYIHCTVPCRCGHENNIAPSFTNDFVQQLDVNVLLKLHEQNPSWKGATLMRHALCGRAVPCSRPGCGGTIPRYLGLTSAPRVVCVSIDWRHENPEPLGDSVAIEKCFEMLDKGSLHLADLFAGLPGPTEAYLVAIVCDAGPVTVSFSWMKNECMWMRYDTQNGTRISGDWEGLERSCVRENLRPNLLVFESQRPTVDANFAVGGAQMNGSGLPPSIVPSYAMVGNFQGDTTTSFADDQSQHHLEPTILTEMRKTPVRGLVADGSPHPMPGGAPGVPLGGNPPPHHHQPHPQAQQQHQQQHQHQHVPQHMHQQQHQPQHRQHAPQPQPPVPGPQQQPPQHLNGPNPAVPPPQSHPVQWMPSTPHRAGGSQQFSNPMPSPQAQGFTSGPSTPLGQRGPDTQDPGYQAPYSAPSGRHGGYNVGAAPPQQQQQPSTHAGPSVSSSARKTLFPTNAAMRPLADSPDMHSMEFALPSGVLDSSPELSSTTASECAESDISAANLGGNWHGHGMPSMPPLGPAFQGPTLNANGSMSRGNDSMWSDNTFGAPDSRLATDGGMMNVNGFGHNRIAQGGIHEGHGHDYYVSQEVADAPISFDTPMEQGMPEVLAYPSTNGVSGEGPVISNSCRGGGRRGGRGRRRGGPPHASSETRSARTEQRKSRSRGGKSARGAYSHFTPGSMETGQADGGSAPHRHHGEAPRRGRRGGGGAGGRGGVRRGGIKAGSKV